MKDNYGRANAKQIKRLEKIAKLVVERESLYRDMTDEQLSLQTQILKDRLANGETLDQILPDAYAVCREASARVLHQRHYFVQILGGISLHQGRICQMATGEGKTLTETLPAYLNALSGNGVHIITVNEYLAKRDAEWMGKVFKFLGLTVGITISNQTDAQKRDAYLCDITYGTNSEFGFDYLRDNLSTSKANRVQRQLNFVIIDEVDSILIDEARTPLIISGPSGKPSSNYISVNAFVVKKLKNSTNVDDEGNVKSGDKKEQPNGDYVVDKKDKQVFLTESGVKKAEEHFGVENLAAPTCNDLNSYINNALRAHAIMKRDEDYVVERGAVVIVDSFTGRKMPDRRFSAGLHQAIEAKEFVTIKEESKTFATITLQNYFRLYHKLSGMTGTAKTEEEEFNTIYNVDVVAIPTNKPNIRVDQPDIIYSTRAGKLKAIVKEIAQRHATGQPLLVGTITVDKSEELSRMLKAVGIKHNVLNANSDQFEAEIIAQAGRLGAVTIATNMAGRGTDILLGGNAEFLAKMELKRLGYDQVQVEVATNFAESDNPEITKLQQVYSELLQKYQSKTEIEKYRVIQLGGLCVIGTERHESRRIDNQLRGRAGRQGDPGCSIFFVSAEDDMIRIFVGDRIQSIMNFLRFDEDTPIQNKIISKLIESAQKRLEAMHFESRKNVLKFDDVNNAQRKIIYKERNRIFDGDDLHDEICTMAVDYARNALGKACKNDEDVKNWNLPKLNVHLFAFFPWKLPQTPPQNGILTEEHFIVTQQMIDDAVEQSYGNRKVKPAQIICDYLTQLTVERLSYCDEQPVSEGAQTFRESERVCLLNVIDHLWIDHIDELDELRKGVGLQSIGQRNPLDVYKKEAFELFDQLNENIRIQTLFMLLVQNYRAKTVTVSQTADVNPEKALNKPCPCGSGKKYKHCCYPKDLARQQVQSQLGGSDEQPLSKKDEYRLKREQRQQNKKGKKQ